MLIQDEAANQGEDDIGVELTLELIGVAAVADVNVRIGGPLRYFERAFSKVSTWVGARDLAGA